MKNSSSDVSSKSNAKVNIITINKCCNKVKCLCVSFLWKGVNVNLGSSDEGMYGETREKSLRTIFKIMSKYGLDENSIFCDIGSGRGAPSIVASFQNQIFSSIGIELDENPYYLSLSNVMHTLENYENLLKTEISKVIIENNRKEARYKQDLIYPKNRIGFIRGDATVLNSFEPVTHIYSFDAAMPIWMVKKFVDLFNASKTTYCYLSYRKDLVEVLNLDGTRIHGISTQMMGSGEGRMCWLYLKKNWEEIRKFSIDHISETFNVKMINSEPKNLRLSKTNSLYKIVEITMLSITTQKSIISNSLDEWFNNRKSRRECISERKAMNQWHKELKQSFLSGKLSKEKESSTQLTLEDMGISIDSKIRSPNSNSRKHKGNEENNCSKNLKLNNRRKPLKNEKLDINKNNSDNSNYGETISSTLNKTITRTIDVTDRSNPNKKIHNTKQ
ncbi:hypothetical protein FG386_000442 [Cryptosporidium ryanae]|uniref:uncharacterized protein n=1 Tax=Cryptosporidium ryanae TaxID=515981 RepID=UPI00351A56BB|nr:hypothetical protein FG386_000442 [Cryptosporidium ryanae]